MKIENIPADIKSKSLKEAWKEIDQILINLETKNLDFNSATNQYKRLIILNRHIGELFKKRSKEILSVKSSQTNDKK